MMIMINQKKYDICRLNTLRENRDKQKWQTCNLSQQQCAYVVLHLNQIPRFWFTTNIRNNSPSFVHDWCLCLWNNLFVVYSLPEFLMIMIKRQSANNDMLTLVFKHNCVGVWHVHSRIYHRGRLFLFHFFSDYCSNNIREWIISDILYTQHHRSMVRWDLVIQIHHLKKWMNGKNTSQRRFSFVGEFFLFHQSLI